MKILLISDLYPIEDDKTIPSVIEDFALAFIERGIELTVIRPDFLFNSFIRKRKIIKEGIYKRNGINIYHKNFITPFLIEKKDFIEKIKKESFSLIISHMPSGHLYSYLINKNLKLPHCAIAHYSDYKVLNEFKYSFYFKPRLKSALSKANIIGARNKFLMEKLKADFILPSFVKKENILNKKQSEFGGKLRIITLSKLIKRKNIDLVIKALHKAQLNNDFDFEYDIYGEGEEEKRLKKLIKKYNLNKKIKIHQYINHDLIFNCLDKKDIFILPSIKESFGLSYLESMARGLITIGVKNCGIDGVIKNNKNGFLINPLKEDIYEILNKVNSIDREKIAKETLLTVKNYEKEKIMEEYIETIKKIL